MITVVAGTLVVAFAGFLIGLAGLIAIQRTRAERFVRSFASSAGAHYLEQVLRLIAGGALVIFAPSMWHEDLFRLFGWFLTVSAIVLLVLPWRWHHALGTTAIPLVIRYMPIFAIGALALGLFLLYGLSRIVLV